jgi:hypothetical protein
MTIRTFLNKLTHNFGWRQERACTFSSLVIGLVSQNNVQHHALSHGLDTKGSLKAKLERIRRFFANQEIDYKQIAKAIVQHIFGKIPKMHLILDRTNWKFGSEDINYLVLAARVGRVTFPLFWTLLDHGGCSDYDHRRDLLEQFRVTFGFDYILSFTADREFIGQEWIDYLCTHNIPFLSALRIIVSFNGVKPKHVYGTSLCT